MATLYPVELTSYSGGNITTIQNLITDLKAATTLLSYLGVNAATIENELLSWYNQYGKFAISIGFSINTGFTTMYINMGGNTNPEICNAIESSSVGRAIQAAFDHGLGFAIKCGTSITDTYTLRRSVIPDIIPPFRCSTPVSFVYLFGTINVTYD